MIKYNKKKSKEHRKAKLRVGGVRRGGDCKANKKMRHCRSGKKEKNAKRSDCKQRIILLLCYGCLYGATPFVCKHDTTRHDKNDTSYISKRVPKT